MIEDIQKTIITILGRIALLTLVEILILVIILPSVDITIIVGLTALVNTIVGGLVGFLTGKKLSDYENQKLKEKLKNYEETTDTSLENEEITEIEEVITQEEEKEENEEGA